MSKYCKGNCIIKSKCYFYPQEGSNYCNVHSENVKECSICLNNIQMYSCEKMIFHNNIAYKLKCGHFFHYKCIEEMFLRGRLQCPMCRTRLEDEPMYMNIKKLENNIKEQERYNTTLLLDIQNSQRRTETNGRRLLDAFLGLSIQESEEPTTENPNSSPSL